MTPIEAIKTALRYEKKVYQVYVDAAAQARDATARKFFELMADEEKSHVDFLESKLADIEGRGGSGAVEVATALPPSDKIRQGLARLKERFASNAKNEAFGTELAALRRALDAETETSSFYRRMVGELREDGRDIFKRFLEIEEGHRAIVAAELDAVENNGFWFDIQEFNQEMGR